MPHGDLDAAKAAAAAVKIRGLRCVSYTVLIRRESADRSAVIETALALGAPNIRIWAGHERQRRNCARRARRYCG